MAYELRPLVKGSSEAHRLITEYLEECRRDGKELWVHGLEGLLGTLDHQEIPGVLIAPPGGPAIGIATEHQVPTYGRNVELLYADAEHRSVDSWREVLSLLRASRGDLGPMILSTGDLAGLNPEDERSLFTRLGFAGFSRWDMQYPQGTPAPSLDPVEGETARPLVESDVEEVAQLHTRAFAHSVDRFLFLADPNPIEDSRRLMRMVFSEEFGPLIEPCHLPSTGLGGAASANAADKNKNVPIMKR